MNARVLLAGLLVLGAGCKEPVSNTPVKQYTARVVAEYPHKTTSFTQGLIFHEGKLYEGTGKKGGSSLYRVDLASGQPELSHDLELKYFGEGITLLDGKLYQLTWKSGTGFVYAAADFKPLKSFKFSGEGWGLTHDGKRLVMSDGTPRLTFLDPRTLAPTGSLTVRHRGKPVKFLNELEFIEGEIWANLWGQDVIARIDPENGRVVGWIDCQDIRPGNPEADVFNGIAYDPATGRIFVTGKRWDTLFEIEVVESGKSD